LLITNAARLSSANIPLYAKSGATGIWRIIQENTYAVAPTGTGRAAWNEFTGGAWQQTEVTNNDFVLAHIFAVNDASVGNARRFIAIQGEAAYNNLTLARAGATTEINSVVTTGLPFVEFVPLGTIIYQTGDGYSNPVKSRIRTTDLGEDYVDLREFRFSANSGGPSDHGALANLGNDDHLQYLLLAGRAGGQSAIGGTAASEDLTLTSTSNATKGWVSGAEGERISFYDNGRTGTGVDACKAFFKHAPTANGSNHFGVISAV